MSSNTEVAGRPAEGRLVERPLLEVKHLKRYFTLPHGPFTQPAVVRAVDDVSFTIGPGETFGLVGESGCGKTTLGRTILRLLPATSGEVSLDGRDILHLSGRSLRAMRQEVQAIFQDPLGSLNPRMKVGDIIAEPGRAFGLVSRRNAKPWVAELMKQVGLDARQAESYPHQLSGGQRQRVGIARAISVRPRLVVADEPVSALDVSVQAQIINLLVNLQREFEFSYLFIGHGLPVVRHISQRVGVMYLGKLVEVGPAEELFSHPAHPYTIALRAAAPVPSPQQSRERIVLEGEIPSPTNPPSGCPFRTRCPFAQPICAEQAPPLREVRPGQWAACHFPHA